MADLGVKCRGLRHEETIRRQKEGLAELRERIKMLEKGQSSGKRGHPYKGKLLPFGSGRPRGLRGWSI